MAAALDEEGSAELAFEVERDANTHEIIAIHNLLTPYTSKPFTLRRYSTVMVKADPGCYEFLAYIRKFVDVGHSQDGQHEVRMQVCWFYRAHEVMPRQTDTVVCKAHIQGRAGARADQGTFKEIYLSNHKQEELISSLSIMHPIKVWLLPDDSTAPLELNPPGASSSGTQPAALLPGFICRRFYNPKKAPASGAVQTLSNLLAGNKPGVEDWLLQDLADMFPRSQLEREAFKAEWLQEVAARQAAADAEDAGS